jgi:branched-subunit amino acid ABC-type transport system permease component
MGHVILGVLFIFAAIFGYIFREKAINYQIRTYVKPDTIQAKKSAIKILNIRIIAGSIVLIFLGIYFILFHK